MKSKTGRPCARTVESVSPHMFIRLISMKAKGDYICKNGGKYVAMSSHRRLRVAEFSTYKDAEGWLRGRSVTDMFGNRADRLAYDCETPPE